MAKTWTRDISDQKAVTLELDLAELFSGYLVSDSTRLREAVGQEIIDIIRNRTQDKERSWTGASFANYSEEYADSIDFKAYHKSKDEPNLTQSGDMLGLMTVLDGESGKVVIGWNDTLQSEKAHGHITGNVGRKRDFFGLTSDEIDKIREKFASDLERVPSGNEEVASAFQSFLSGERSILESSIDSIVESFFGDGDV